MPHRSCAETIRDHGEVWKGTAMYITATCGTAERLPGSGDGSRDAQRGAGPRDSGDAADGFRPSGRAPCRTGPRGGWTGVRKTAEADPCLGGRAAGRPA